MLQLFIGKLAAIQSKMKILTKGFHSLIIYILDSNGKVKDLHEWSNSFDHIVDLPQVVSIFQDDIDEFIFNELVDTLFKIETDLNRFTTEGKVVTNARWQKLVNELATAKTCEWPTKREFNVWERITKLKALPTGSSWRKRQI